MDYTTNPCKIQIDEWVNCYDGSWSGILTPAAFSHPAKFSRNLITKIISHALDEGWIQPGQTVLDPFSGVACGALPCLQAGLHYVGVELEEKFVTLARENIALWNNRYAAHFPNWGSAQVIRGDSRRLAEVVREAGLVVSSPPFQNQFASHDNFIAPHDSTRLMDTGKDAYGSTPGQLGAMKNGDISAVISSPPFAGNSGGRGEASRNGIEPGLFDRHSGGMKGGTGDDPANLDHLKMGDVAAVIGSPPYAGANVEFSSNTLNSTRQDGSTMRLGKGNSGDYGLSDGQLGAMKSGEISAVIASPPFADSVGSDDPDKRGGLFRDEKRRNDTNLTGTYGQTDGQLGGMKAGVAVVGSPPFENQNACNDPKYQTGRTTNGGPLYGDYGSTAGQIGATQGDTFWSAARLIVEQCALLLPPGGAAIWVLKAYVKDGQIVDFPDQWQQLCEACGFETLHIHRAMLVKRRGSQGTMATGHDTTSTATNLLGKEVTTGGKALADKSLDVERYSFFRRLHIKKNPHLAIEWETVLCTRKAA